MWDNNASKNVSRRERQVLEIVMRRGSASAREIEAELPDAPTYSAVRSILRMLVDKELLIKSPQGRANEFTLPMAPEKARVKALHQMVRDFFSNSVGSAAMALLGDRKSKLSKEEADTLMKLIQEAREK
ncbi:MAG: BlaI/MecI/CopY family transcriptional regulator [Prosthecobacter sp.]